MVANPWSPTPEYQPFIAKPGDKAYARGRAIACCPFRIRISATAAGTLR